MSSIEKGVHKSKPLSGLAEFCYLLDQADISIGTALGVIEQLRMIVEELGIKKDEFADMQVQDLLSLMNQSENKFLVKLSDGVNASILSVLKEQGVLPLSNGRKINIKFLTKKVDILFRAVPLKKKLEEMGITYLGEVVLQSHEDLLKNLGEAYMNQILLILGNEGLVLGEESEDAKLIQDLIDEHKQKMHP